MLLNCKFMALGNDKTSLMDKKSGYLEEQSALIDANVEKIE